MVEALGVPGCRVTAATDLDGGLMLSVVPPPVLETLVCS